MEFFTMQCPNCNANLEIENGIDSFYCKYCGTKIMITGQDKHTVKAKAAVHVLNKIQEIIDDDRKYKTEHLEEIEAQREAAHRRARENERDNNLQILAAFGVLIAVGLLALLFGKIM